jgi:HrpA-like RNA helicase
VRRCKVRERLITCKRLSVTLSNGRVCARCIDTVAGARCRAPTAAPQLSSSPLFNDSSKCRVYPLHSSMGTDEQRRIFDVSHG